MNRLLWNFLEGSVKRLNGTYSSLSGITSRGLPTLTQGTSPSSWNLFSFQETPQQQNIFMQQVRYATRGRDFRPNTYKRIKKHGRATKMKTLNGKITIIRRMLKGISPRKLTH